MSETPFENSQNSDDELLVEYKFDYQKAKPNRFANRSGTQGLTVVVLDEDVAKVFQTSESVNKALREFIESMPQTPNKAAKSSVAQARDHETNQIILASASESMLETADSDTPTIESDL